MQRLKDLVEVDSSTDRNISNAIHALHRTTKKIIEEHNENADQWAKYHALRKTIEDRLLHRYPCKELPGIAFDAEKTNTRKLFGTLVKAAHEVVNNSIPRSTHDPEC